MTAKRNRERNCILVMDANILIQDFWLSGSGWQYLLKRNFLLHKIAIPNIVLEEAAANLERRAEDLLQRIETAGHTARLRAQHQRLFNRKSIGRESPAELAARYKRFIRRTVKQYKGIIVDPPDVPLEALVERSIRRRKPFNQGDRGFRDTLIWMNTLALVQEHHRVSFVSANTSDYSENGGLHPDLEKDLAPILPEHVHFRYFTGLNEFIAFMDRDGDAGAEALRYALMSEGYRGFHLDHWLIDNLDDLLRHYELDGIAWTALPYWAENPRLVALDELVGIEVHGERAAGADLVEFYCDLALLGTFQCSILFANWKSVVHPRQVEWVDEQSSDMWTEVGVRSVGTFLLRLVFDLNAATVIEHDIVAIPHDIQGSKAALEELKDALSGDD